MKIKNIISFVILLALPTLLFTSCLKDQEDVFDQDSSKRMQDALQNAKDVLRSQANGWVMDYYVGDSSEDGGYAFIVKFDSLTCWATSEVDDTLSDTSYYMLTNDNGPVLTFNTYNKVLHQFATPSSGNYEGDHADFEFTIMSATSDLVVLKGKRIGNMAYLRPLTKTPEQYLADVKTMSDSLFIGSGVGKLGGVNIEATLDVDNRQITFASLDDPTQRDSCAYTITDKGIRLGKNITFGGESIFDLAYDWNTETITSLDSGASDFVMTCSKPKAWRDFADFEGNYLLAYEETYNGTTTRDTMEIGLVPNSDGKTYRMTGVADNYDITCSYRKSKGCLEINPQSITVLSNGNELQICILDYSASTLTWTEKAGLLIQWDGVEREQTVYNISTNSYEDFISGGIILWMFADGEAQTGTAIRDFLETSAGSVWMMKNGSYFIPGMTSLIKVN